MRQNADRIRFGPAWVAVIVLGAIGVGRAAACDVPVFRYALERWPPSYYGLVVFHRGGLAEGPKKVADWLKQCGNSEETPCNVDVYLADVDDPNLPEAVTELRKQQKDLALPWMVACYPRRWGPLLPAWAGPVTAANAKALVDSPVRQEIARRIVAGETAVWVLLEGGDKAKDDAAEKLVQSELKELSTELRLPIPAAALYPGADEDELPPGPPLKIAFSTLRLSPKDPNERLLVELLLNTEEDLRTDYASDPKVFAFFGRGRSMLALVGEGINEDNVAAVCEFLVGRCSCQVKEQNPGVDMIFAVDWLAGFEEEGYTAPPLPDLIVPVAATSAPAAAMAARAELPAGPLAVQPPVGGGLLLQTTLIALGCIGLAAAVLVVWFTRRPSRS